MKTDTRRQRRTDPGVPDDCPVFDFHKSFSSEAERNEITTGCTSASIGCIDCKKILIKNLNNFLDPFRERRAKYETLKMDDIVENGSQEAKEAVGQTLGEVRELMKI